MGKAKVGTRPNEFKYGMGLYGVAWPEGDYYFVCGGGGMGLVPRIVWAQYKHGKCSDQLGEYTTGKNTPMRMTICPWGTSLLVGNANGGIRRLQIGTESYHSKIPRLVDVSASFMESLSDLNAEVGTMTFNSGGNLLAIGFKEREVKEPSGEYRKLPGLVKIISYPSMRPLLELTLEDPEVKDVDFCHMPIPQHQQHQQQHHQQQHQQQQGFELVATVGGHGVCQVWRVQQSGAQVIAQLELPKGLGNMQGKAKFNRCRFGRSSRASKANSNHSADQDLVLFTQINCRLNKMCVCYLAAYGPPPEGLESGRPWQCLKHVVAHNQNMGSCMDISKHGEWIAFGFSEGDLRVYDATTLQLYKQDEASIAFVTSAVFNADNTAVIAVGGDANCYVMELVTKPKGRGWLLILFLLLALGVAVAALHFWQHPQQLPYQLLQQLQQWSKQPDHPLMQACSSSSSWQSFPLQQPVCDWVLKAAHLLPEYGHDEL